MLQIEEKYSRKGTNYRRWKYLIASKDPTLIKSIEKILLGRFTFKKVDAFQLNWESKADIFNRKATRAIKKTTTE